MINLNIQSAYEKEKHLLCLNRLKIGLLLTFVGIPSGAVLDLYVYPEYFQTFLKIRLFSTVLAISLYALVFTSYGIKNVRLYSYLWGYLVNGYIATMIFASSGANSSYYAGLNLVILAVAIMFPWSYKEVLGFCFGTDILYLFACGMNQMVFGNPIEASIFVNNLYFLFIVQLIATVSSYFAECSRFKDFSLRYELDQKNKELEQMDKLKSRFFANISHELRTPLTLIMSPIQDVLRKADALPGRVHNALLIAMQNSMRLLKLVNELLDMMRLQEGKMKLNYEKVNLSSFVPGILDSVRHLGAAKKLKMLMNNSEQHEEAFFLEADPNCLEKILLNLLTNAIKFTPRGGAVRVRFYQERGDVCIEVTDTGVGIALEDQSKIFDRFHQVDASSTRKFQGVGIGLALAKELVEKHKGHLDLQSTLGKGTTFTVRFPLCSDKVCITASQAENEGLCEAEEEEFLVNAEPIAAAFKSAGRFLPIEPHHSDAFLGQPLPEVGRGDHTILVVDDEPDMRRYMVSILSTDFHVLQAVDGAQGWETAQRKPDLILLDWMLPELNGLEVCKKIRADPELEDIKIIIITARADEESKISALQAGANDFLTKPFSTIEVETRIRNQLKTADLQRGLKHQNCELDAAFKQLKQTEAQLVQSEKVNAIGTLSAGLLHEINNPLNFTFTALHFAKSSLPEDDPALLETMTDIHDGMTRIKDIVSDLRVFAYPENEAKREMFSAESLVDPTLRMLAHELKDQKLECEIDSNQQIYGSRIQLSHVLINFLSNSLKATKKIKEVREPVIKLSLDTANEYISVRVWDNGTGIKEADKERIFDPFFTTADVGQGTGLGLSTCHTIIRNHQGQIYVNSKEGHWTEISFDLPIRIKE